MTEATRFQMIAHATPPRRLRAPVHCVLGDADPATPAFETAYTGWEVFAESVTIKLLRGAGHYFIRDRAAELARIIDGRESARTSYRTPVICLPHTGAGASFFHPWQQQIGDVTEIVALDMPGHEKRFADEPCRRVSEAVDDLLPRLLAALGGRDEVVLFGHCLGATIAFELAERLVEAGVTVRHLLVSGAPGPTVARARRTTGLPDREFLDCLADLAGYAHPALADPDMAELLLPVLRADQEMYESYERASIVPRDIPVAAIRGSADRLVSAEDLAQWQHASIHPLRQYEAGGGHMYLAEDAGIALRLLTEVTS